MKTLGGESKVFDVAASDKVTDVKELIVEWQGIPVEAMRLVHGRATLQDDADSIEAAGVKNGSTLILLVVDCVPKDSLKVAEFEVGQRVNVQGCPEPKVNGSYMYTGAGFMQDGGYYDLAPWTGSGEPTGWCIESERGGVAFEVTGKPGYLPMVGWLRFAAGKEYMHEEEQVPIRIEKGTRAQDDPIDRDDDAESEDEDGDVAADENVHGDVPAGTPAAGYAPPTPPTAPTSSG